MRGDTNAAAVDGRAAGLHTHHDLRGPRHVTDAVFLHQVMQRGLIHLQNVQSPGGLDAIPRLQDLGAVLCVDRTTSREELVIDVDGAVALIVCGRESIDVNLAAPCPVSLEQAVDRLLTALGPRESTDPRVWVMFWASDRERGPTATARRVRMPRWEDVRADHSTSTRAELERLVGIDRLAAGSLILWHGPPGTGKTHALRALVRGWCEWCVPHFITDPERLLGDASYLMRVLASSDPDRMGNREWRLLILEDAGELLTADARERSGQSLSRLLNATDGLLGQSTNTLVLVTTNEPVGRLHPAVVRRGRCLSEVEFGPLSVEEANAWLASAGCSATVSSPAVLGDLYAMREGQVEPVEVRRVGFAA